MAYAQLECGILRERVKAGMERARREGRHIGRPPVTERLGVAADGPRCVQNSTRAPSCAQRPPDG